MGDVKWGERMGTGLISIPTTESAEEHREKQKYSMYPASVVFIIP